MGREARGGEKEGISWFQRRQSGLNKIIKLRQQEPAGRLAEEGV